MPVMWISGLSWVHDVLCGGVSEEMSWVHPSYGRSVNDVVSESPAYFNIAKTWTCKAELTSGIDPIDIEWVSLTCLVSSTEDAAIVCELGERVVS